MTHTGLTPMDQGLAKVVVKEALVALEVSTEELAMEDSVLDKGDLELVWAAKILVL